MALNSLLFFACVAAACLVNYMLPRKARYVWLFLFSWAFYWVAAVDVELNTPSLLMRLGLGPTMPGAVPAFCILAFITGGTWLLCLFMGKATHKALRAALLAGCLLLVLGVWVACKYLGVLAFFRPYNPGIMAEGSTPATLALPLGLSFATLQAVGYALDVYARRTEAEINPIRYAAFVAFFPAVTVGPINRAAHLMPQLKAPAAFDYGRVSGGAFRLLWGVFKKSVIADCLLVFTAPVFRNPTLYAGPVLTLGVLLYALQLYADFSGLCDIAAGAARMLGIENAENFRLPFGARTMADFWGRWAISITGVLRAAVTTPLRHLADAKPALQKAKKPLTLTGTLVVFTLFGLWHRLDISMLLFAWLNGALVCAAVLLKGPKDKLAARVPLYKNDRVRGVFQRIFVYLLFCATLVFFLCSINGQPLSGWATRFLWNWGMLGSGEFFAVVAERGLTLRRFAAAMGGTALMAGIEAFALRENGTVADWIRRRRFFVRWPLYYSLIAALIFFGEFAGAKGIYQQF